MPLILDFQYYYERNMHTPDTSIHTEKPPKYVWKADMQENYIDNVRLNLEQIADESHQAIVDSNYDLPLKLLMIAIYNAAQSMKKHTFPRKTSSPAKPHDKPWFDTEYVISIVKKQYRH